MPKSQILYICHDFDLCIISRLPRLVYKGSEPTNNPIPKFAQLCGRLDGLKQAIRAIRKSDIFLCNCHSGTGKDLFINSGFPWIEWANSYLMCHAVENRHD